MDKQENNDVLVDGERALPNGPLSSWPSYSEEEIDAVERVLRSGKVNYWTGDECKQFESEFAAYHGVKHGIALANGTLALELALRVLDIGVGDEVIVSPRSYFASVSCIVLAGATPVFVDVDRDSQNISAEVIESAITDRTKAIITVHLAGWPCDMPAIMKLARRQGLFVIEDCAQAHGARIDGKPIGSFGHLACFSFCQDKIMTTAGEGGILITDDDRYWQEAWSFKEHGKSWDRVRAIDHPPGFRWLHESFGTNFRMTELQAAVGRVQLTKLRESIERRKINAERITRTLSRFRSVRVPEPPAEITHAYYRLYAFVVSEHLAEGWDRDRIMEELSSAGIPCFSGSCPEIYREKAFDHTGLRPDVALVNAKELGLTSLALLVHPTLTSVDMDRICGELDRVLSKATR